MTQRPDEPYQQQPPPPPGGAQQYPGYQPYGAPPPGPGSYPGGPGYPMGHPPPSSGSGKTVAIIVGSIVLVALLFCGGIITAIVMLINNVEDQLDDFDPDRTGGRNNPIEVEVGEAFDIDGVSYAEGWSIGSDEADRQTIVGLKATNDRDDEQSDYVYLNFTFMSDDNVELAEITCASDGRIGCGNSEDLDCIGSDKVPATYDRIEVSDG